MIIEKFHNQLSHRLPSDDMDTMFINILEILRVHRSFLGKLTPVVLKALGLQEPLVSTFPSDPSVGVVQQGSPSHHHQQNIGDVFRSSKLNFTIYAEYCSRLSQATARIEELERWSLIC